MKDVRIEPKTREGDWLGPPLDDGTHKEREVLAELMRSTRLSGDEHDVRRASIEPPAYKP